MKNEELSNAMIELDEEKLKALGFYKTTNEAWYRKDYPATENFENRLYSAFIGRYWDDDKQKYVWRLDERPCLYAGYLGWEMDEKTSIEKMVEDLKTAFNEFKQDMKELRNDYGIAKGN